MRKLRLSRVNWYFIILALASVLIAVDILSKNWIRAHLQVGQSWPETGFFRLTHVQNTGAAFSIFYGKSDILTVVSIAGVIFLLAYIFIIYRHFPFLDTGVNKISLGMILGGTVGNLVDRLSQSGIVTDFIDIGPWAIFNVADSSIVAGVIVFALSVLFTTLEERQEHHQ